MRTCLTIEVTSRSPLEVALLESSGHEDLDGAALEIGKRMRVETDCLRSTVKRAIHFEKEPDPPRSSGTSDYILTGETHIWVEEL